MKVRRIYTNPDLCTGCRLCASACSVRRFGACNPNMAAITIWQDLFERFEGQRLCRQCEDPKCMEACMNNCVTKNPDTGVVKHDQSRCVGCWMCVMVCPFGSISTGGRNADGRKIAVRCDLCEGEQTPHCVLVCPTGAIACVEESKEVEAV